MLKILFIGLGPGRAIADAAKRESNKNKIGKNVAAVCVIILQNKLPGEGGQGHLKLGLHLSSSEHQCSCSIVLHLHV